MCNYYCVYAFDDSKKSACVSYLKRNASDVSGFYYKVYPKLSTIPFLFKQEGFGMKRGFFAICMYTGDAVAMPYADVFMPGQTYIQHLYTQDDECRRYFDGVGGLKRPRNYGTPGVYRDEAAEMKWLDDEFFALEEIRREDELRIGKWKADHAEEIREAVGVVKKIERECKVAAAEKAVVICNFEKRKGTYKPEMYGRVFNREYGKLLQAHPGRDVYMKAKGLLYQMDMPSIEYVRRKREYDDRKRRLVSGEGDYTYQTYTSLAPHYH